MNLSGAQLDYLKAFLGGVGISFSPCVYPLLPITVSFIGIRAGTSKFRGLTLSLTYVTGIAVTYSILGLLTSLAGIIFGSIAANPLTYFLVGIVIVLFGVSMFDVFNISLPDLIKLPTLKKQGYFSAFLLGLSSGLIIGPCTTPVLGTILVYLATKKNILYGITLLLSFAYGMGLILVLAGTFSNILIGLPKSGKWMVYIKRIGAAILIVMGIYFIFAGIKRL